MLGREAAMHQLQANQALLSLRAVLGDFHICSSCYTSEHADTIWFRNRLSQCRREVSLLQPTFHGLTVRPTGRAFAENKDHRKPARQAQRRTEARDAVHSIPDFYILTVMHRSLSDVPSSPEEYSPYSNASEGNLEATARQRRASSVLYRPWTSSTAHQQCELPLSHK